jgi:hypothetical protein
VKTSGSTQMGRVRAPVTRRCVDETAVDEMWSFVGKRREQRGVRFKALAGTGARMDIRSANGRLTYRVGRSEAEVSDA